MSQAAAKRAAGADRVMRDMACHGCQQPTERTVDHRTVKGGMAHAGANSELVVLDGESREARYVVDVDEVRGQRQP